MTKKEGAAESAQIQSGRRMARHRSPNFPYIGLEKAIARAGEIWEVFRVNWTPERAIHEKWGYSASALGSQGLVTVAALKAFGLIKVDGSGKNRKIALTEEGRRIVLNADDRENLLKQAALMPPIYKEVWEHYQGYIPKKDEDLRRYLLVEKKFNDQSVDRFISEFRDTIGFTKLEPGLIFQNDEKMVEPKTGLPLPEDILGKNLMSPLLTRFEGAGSNQMKASQIQDYTIPIKGQQVAILRVGRQLTADDVKRIKIWLDLLDTSEPEEMSGEGK